jgi:PAT family beta-lactamase induction signal transducer AmpG
VPTLSESRLLRFFTFGALYFAQGVPWGFISIGYVVFLTDLGFDNSTIGAAMGVAYLPWTFKILWGPIVDRFPSARFGRRRPFIIVAEFLMGATLLMLYFLDPKTNVALMSGVLFFHNTFASLQDVAVDAMAVDILPTDEAGRANSVMWACKVGGVAIGGSGGAVLAKHLGLPVLFITLAAVMWTIMGIVIVVRERPQGAPATGSPGAADPARENEARSGAPGTSAGARELTSLEQAKELVRSFAFPTAILGLLIALLTPVGYALTSAVTTRMYRADLKLTEEQIGLLQGALASGVGAVGAIIGGFVADYIGVRKVIAFSMLGIAASLCAFGLLPHLWPSMTFLIGFTIVLQLFIVGYNAATLGFFMRMSNPLIGATQFAIFMAATNLTYSLTSTAGGKLADRFGLPTTFLIAAVIQLVTIGLLPFCDPRVAEARFRTKGQQPIPLPEVAKAPGA